MEENEKNEKFKVMLHYIEQIFKHTEDIELRKRIIYDNLGFIDLDKQTIQEFLKCIKEELKQ